MLLNKTRPSKHLSAGLLRGVGYLQNLLLGRMEQIQFLTELG